MIIIDSYKYRKYLLDLFPATVAYSLRKLRAGQTRAIRVRRSSDNAEQDIGFVGDETASLLSFCGVGNGFVTTWYDQSGNGYDATQPIQANQPQIVSSGVVITDNGKPAVNFGSLHGLEFTINAGFLTSFGTQADITIFTVNKLDNLFTSTVCIGKTNNRGISYFSESAFFKARCSSGVKNALISFDNQRKLSFINKTTASISLALNGGATVSSLNDYANFFSEDILILGQLAGFPYGAYGGGGPIQEVVIYNSDQTANRTAIESNINTHYTIY